MHSITNSQLITNSKASKSSEQNSLRVSLEFAHHQYTTICIIQVHNL